MFECWRVGVYRNSLLFSCFSFPQRLAVPFDNQRLLPHIWIHETNFNNSYQKSKMSRFCYPSEQETQDLVSRFKRKLNDDLLELLDDYLTSPHSVGLEASLISEIETGVAQSLSIGSNSVCIVGSAKIGFRIHRNDALGKLPFKSFSDESDVDVAVVNSDLFDEIWLDLFEFQLRRRDWRSRENFEKYFFRGWIRPDMLPHQFAWRYKWFDCFRDLKRATEGGRHNLSGGLYKSYEFLYAYQRESFKRCLREL